MEIPLFRKFLNFSPQHTDNPSEFLPILLTCDIIIYDVTWEQSQTEEASWAIQGL